MSNLRVVDSSESSSIFQVHERCCNATTLKISLLVFGFLLVAGAIAAHLYQVNAFAVYTMGGAGGLLIFGVFTASIIQRVQNRRSEIQERADQNSQARSLGLDVDQLPESIEVIKNNRQKKLNAAVQGGINLLDGQIETLHRIIEQFRKIINDPSEPLEVGGALGAKKSLYLGTHPEKINRYWLSIKIMYSPQNMLNSVLNELESCQNEGIIQKQQEMATLRNQLLELRQESYRHFIQSLGREELLKEAQKYYLNTFLKEERVAIKEFVEQMNLESIGYELKERLLAQAKNDYDSVEMQEILFQIEHAEDKKVEEEKKSFTLPEQASQAALSFECQRNKLPNVAPLLERISAFMKTASQQELISISGLVTDQILNEWATAVSKYLEERWAWPDASGRYSLNRQLVTDPNLNSQLCNPDFILALFGRSQLGNPIVIFKLSVAEMLIAGFRDQHPALLECQPYNNAFFVEDTNIVQGPAYEERLLTLYLKRKECSFIQVMHAIETAAQKIGIPADESGPRKSHFDAIYGSKLWENGNVIAHFRQLKQAIDSEEGFIAHGHNFANSYGQSLQGFLDLCKTLYPENVLVDANPNFTFLSSIDLAERIANHPTVLLDYLICHLWYDVMHLKAMFAGQSFKYPFKDGQFSMIDIVEKILLNIQRGGLKPENAITAQQLYLRLYALADLTIPLDM